MTNEEKNTYVKRVKRLQHLTYTRGIGAYHTTAKCGDVGIIRRMGSYDQYTCKKWENDKFYVVTNSKYLRNGGYYTKNGLIKAIMAIPIEQSIQSL